MPVIRRRHDGAQFVIHAYREILEAKNRGLLKREIKSLAASHGDNVYLAKKGPKKFAAVFANDTGFLLAETVRQFFATADNLIYCEALPETETLILVIVRDGEIYLETQIAPQDVSSELTALIASDSDNKYDVYLYGNVPIAQTQEEDKFYLDAKNSKTFTRLTSSAFNILPLNDNYQLKPLETALTEQHLSQPLLIPGLLMLVVVLLIGYFSWPHGNSILTEIPHLRHKIIAPIIKPYASYKRALQSAKPSAIMRESSQILAIVSELPGWDFQQITFSNGTYDISVKALSGQFSGSLALLDKWAAINKLDLTTTEQGVNLSKKSNLKSRHAPKNVYRLGPTLNILLDQLKLIIATNSAKLGKIVTQQQTKVVNLSVDFSDLSPAILNMLGDLLDRFPTTITSITLKNPQASNLLSGTIQFNLWGN